MIPAASASPTPATKPAKIPTPPNSGVGCLCQRSPVGHGDEPRADRRAKEKPEDREAEAERGDRDDRIHNRERVVERPVALDSPRCPFTPT